MTFSPDNLTFPVQVVFTTSPALPVRLTNSGLGILVISKIATTGSFSQTNTCGKINPGANCTINVAFKPATIGTRTGHVFVTDNASGSPQRVALKGTGTYIQLTPASLNFGNQPVGTKSLAKTLILSNKGIAGVNIMGISATGPNAGDFAQTNTCGRHINSGASCTIRVTFKPTIRGSRKAAVSVNDDGGGSPQKVALTGTGT